MAYRNKTYVCFDADNDIHYYRLMQAWKENGTHAFNFHDAHDINNLRDGSSEEQIKKKLRERMANTIVFIVLIGEKTKNLHKYVRWEIELAIQKDIPIIGVNLNGKKRIDDLCPPILRNELAIYIPFKQRAINYALNNWPESHVKYKREGKTGAYYFIDDIYKTHID